MAYVFENRATQKDREKYALRNSFMTQYRTTNSGCDILINDGKEKHKAIIKEHTNPLNITIRDIDKGLLTLDESKVKCGDEITFEGDNRKFLVITNPVSNGVYGKCKIRKLENNIEFKIKDKKYTYQCCVADKLAYDEQSYQNERKVFSEDESTSFIFRYDEATSKLTLFDYILIDGVSHKIAEIDTTLKGCMQIVAYECFADEVFKIDSSGLEFKGLGKFARAKDYQLNSISTKLSTPFKTINQGDVVYHSYKYPNGSIEEKRYITVSNENQNVNCDEFLLYECLRKVNLINGNGEMGSIYCFYENNRYRGRENMTDGVNYEATEYEITMPYNEFTKRLNKETNRILVHIQDEDVEAYTIYGVEKLQKGLVRVSLNSDKVDPNRDLIDHSKQIYIADYYKAINKPSEGIVGDSTIIVGESNTYTCDGNNKWSIDTDMANMVIEDDKCMVTVLDNNKNIGKSFTLTCEVGSEKLTKTINIISW